MTKETLQEKIDLVLNSSQPYFKNSWFVQLIAECDSELKNLRRVASDTLEVYDKFIEYGYHETATLHDAMETLRGKLES
jgi:hypothetical protein